MIRYLLFQTRAHRGEIFEFFRNYSLYAPLEIPFMKFQHNADKGESYFFCVAVVLDETTNDASMEVQEFLSHIINRNNEHNYRQSINEVPNFCGRHFFVESQMEFLRDRPDFKSFKRQVIFEKYEKTRRADIIGGIPVAFENNKGELDDEYGDENFDDIHFFENEPIVDDERMNHLLWWCSAKGEGSFSGFKEACEILKLSLSGDGKTWHLMRRLILLGHLEAVEEGHKFAWGVTPTAIVKPKNGLAYLSGKITPVLVSKLTVNIKLKKSTSNGGPQRIILEDCEGIITSGVPVIPDAARRLADALPSFKNWRDSLDIDPDIQPHRYSFKIFNGKSFIEPNEVPLVIGFYLATRIEGNYQKPTLTFYDGDRWIRGGYYDLRWLGIKNIRENLIVWITKEGSLILPELGRWPLLYERALVLASGILPKSGNLNGIDVLIYDSVGLDTAKILTEKLEVKMVEI